MVAVFNLKIDLEKLAPHAGKALEPLIKEQKLYLRTMDAVGKTPTSIVFSKTTRQLWEQAYRNHSKSDPLMNSGQRFNESTLTFRGIPVDFK